MGWADTDARSPAGAGPAPVDSSADALRALVELVERGAVAGWSFVPAEVAMASSGPVTPWPLVDRDGTVLGVVRRDDRPPEPTDEVFLTLLQCVVGLVATERRQARLAHRASRAEAESLRDALTGLPNRRGWDVALAEEGTRCDRHGFVATIGVVDLDELKLVNDTRGHVAGDELLRTAAQALQAAVRSNDRVARLGGDEFGVLVVSDDGGQPSDLRARITEALERYGVVASVGVATHVPGDPLQATFAAADEAMYVAKLRARESSRR